MIQKLLIKLIFISIISILFIDIFYIWVLPNFFNGYKTYIFLIVGVIVAFLMSSYFCYRTISIITATINSYFLSILVGVTVAALVLSVSLLVIINIKGS